MKTLQEAIRPTTVLRFDKLNDEIEAEIYVFTETFQHTGSFKFRAAYNVASSVSNDTLLTASSGNFGQALAYSAKLLGKKCIVVMPDTSAGVKIEAVRSHGAEVHLIDVNQIGRAEKVSELAKENPDAYVASAYDDPLVIEGNSTIGAEIAEYSDLDYVISPIGGGGLISGISKGLCDWGSRAELHGAEPIPGNDAALSLASGSLIKNETEPNTIADGARTISLGKHNWEYVRNGVKKIHEVTDDQIREAVRFYFSVNLKVEPTGALTLGALIKNKESLSRKRRSGIVVSGGNVDAGIYADIVSG